jgi:hypothetical protein
MAVSEAKKCVMIMLIIMLVVTHAHDAPKSQEIKSNNDISRVICRANCVRKCFQLKETLGQYILCVQACYKRDHCLITIMDRKPN